MKIQSRMFSCFLPGAVVFALGISNPWNKCTAADYIGATAVLERVTNQTNSPATSKKSLSPSEQLSKDIQAFKDKSGSMAPADAAKEWVSLLDRLMQLSLSRNYEEGGRGASLEAVMSALPAPATWGEIVKVVDARPEVKGIKQVREIALRIVAHTLVNDVASQQTYIKSLEGISKESSRAVGSQLQRVIGELKQAMLEATDDPDAILKSLEGRLAQEQQQEFGGSLRVPDLISLIGTNQSEAFLRKALRTKVEISITEGSQTAAMARRLALEMIAELKVPQWQLANSLNSIALYEALEKRFARTTENAEPVDADLTRDSFRNDYNWSEARNYYLLGLIVNQRTKEAVELCQRMGKEEGTRIPLEALGELQAKGHADAINKFFYEALSEHPELPFWNEYFQVAANAGKTDQMLALAKSSAQKQELTNKQRNAIRDNLYKAYLAADQVEQGVNEIRQILANQSNETNVTARARSGYEEDSLGLTLARIGKLTQNNSWLEEGIQAARKILAEENQETYGRAQMQLELAQWLVELGRGPEAEQLLLEGMLKAKTKGGGNRYGVREGNTPQLLTGLIRVYYEAGRHEDVVALLDQAPGWGSKDLADFLREVGEFGMHRGHGMTAKPLAFIAASSLYETGKKEQAAKVLDAFLSLNGGYDPAYQLLIKMAPADLLARLDAMYAKDQFEERPLIWKAHLLRKSGKLDEAETVIRKAISVDPSDGEQGPGDRMRAYAELADIREGLGDKKEADLFRGAVKAIRLSEQADRFYEVGLLRRAVKMYEDSLNQFADAYCIQSRLALRLSQLGFHEAAEEHYRKAYELMPDSFGRVESHCFGCEGVFHGEQAQNLAEKVFTQAVAKNPAKPQVHYLLGYLRQSEGRYREALPEMQQAVKLDPDYLNAWEHLQELSSELHLSSKERDAVTLNLWRLDPLGRQSSPNVSGVTDLRGLWEVAEKALKARPVPPKALYPLTASAAEMEKMKKNLERVRMDFFDSEGSYRGSRGPNTPGAVIAGQSMISSASRLIADSYLYQIDE